MVKYHVPISPIFSCQVTYRKRQKLHGKKTFAEFGDFFVNRESFPCEIFKHVINKQFDEIVPLNRQVFPTFYPDQLNRESFIPRNSYRLRYINNIIHYA